MQVIEHLHVQLGVSRWVNLLSARVWQQIALVRCACRDEGSLLKKVSSAGSQEYLHITKIPPLTRSCTACICSTLLT